MIVLNQKNFPKALHICDEAALSYRDLLNDFFSLNISDADFQPFNNWEIPPMPTPFEDCRTVYGYFGFPEVFQKRLLVQIEKLDIQVAWTLDNSLPLVVRCLDVPNFVEPRVDRADQLEVVVVVTVQLVLFKVQNDEEVFGVQGADLGWCPFQCLEELYCGAVLADLSNLRDGILLASCAVKEYRFVLLTERQFVTRDLVSSWLVECRHEFLVQQIHRFHCFISVGHKCKLPIWSRLTVFPGASDHHRKSALV